MSKIYDIWFRAVVESEKAKEVPGLNPEVFSNIQFTRTVDRNPAGFSDDFWKKVAELLSRLEDRYREMEKLEIVLRNA